MNKIKLLSITLIATVILSVFGGYEYFSLLKEYTELETEHSTLEHEFFNLDHAYDILNESYQKLLLKHIELNSSYNFLNYTYQELATKYTTLNQSYQTLLVNYTRLCEELSELTANYTSLSEEYDALNQSYQTLLTNYNNLSLEHQQLLENYANLLDEYNALTVDYQTLMENYTKLKDDYQKLLKAFNEPLPYKLTPTINELQYWLIYEDDTDKVAYDFPDFVCGDFAVMLSEHAKLKYWDMTIILVFGYNETGYRFDHAFNAMICEEGLVYIEPQTDTVFWYGNHEKIVQGKWYEFPDFPEYGAIYVEEYIEVLWYD